MQIPETIGRIEDLVEVFQSDDGAQRHQARRALVSMGSEIIPQLNKHIDDRIDRVRWEIAKTLEEMKHPSAAPAMVRLLMDDVPGIRWLAGNGLIALRQDALIPLLRGLQVHFHSTFFREGAHHVLREFEREGLLDEKCLRALDALEGVAPAASVPFAAAEALQSLLRLPANSP